MLFEIESRKTLEQVCQDLEKSTADHKFGVMTVHNLKETMKKKVPDLQSVAQAVEYIMIKIMREAAA